MGQSKPNGFYGCPSLPHLPSLTQNLREKILDYHYRVFGGLEQPACPKDLDPDQSLSLREVQGDILRESNYAALVFPIKETDVQRIHFLIVSDFHRFRSPQK
jgi:hypothetical protein